MVKKKKIVFFYVFFDAMNLPAPDEISLLS